MQIVSDYFMDINDDSNTIKSDHFKTITNMFLFGFVGQLIKNLIPWFMINQELNTGGSLSLLSYQAMQ